MGKSGSVFSLVCTQEPTFLRHSASHCMWVPFRPLGLRRESRESLRERLIVLHVLWKFLFARKAEGRQVYVHVCPALACTFLQLIIKVFGPFLLDLSLEIQAPEIAALHESIPGSRFWSCVLSSHSQRDLVLRSLSSEPSPSRSSPLRPGSDQMGADMGCG